MNITLFLETLPYMLRGLIGIFTVTIVIMISITLLNRFTTKK